MFRIYKLCIFCITLLHSFGHSTFKPWPGTPYRLLDRDEKDLFFDRTVFFTLDIENYIGDKRLNKPVTTGVLISKNHVLTSFNVWRNFTKSESMLAKVYLCFILNRTVKPGPRTFYAYDCSNIKCGRPVVPMNDEELAEDQWHGLDKQHSALHDPMVVRLDEELDIYEPDIDYTYEERHSPEDILNEVNRRAGPIITKLPAPTDKFNKHIQFVSLGLTSQLNMKMLSRLELAEFEDSENIEVDCDNWLSKNWGHFFCLVNDEDKYPGFASGALLFLRRTLFGIGSFTMWRGKNSIIVFTDIRPYLKHIVNTCNRDLF